MQNAVYEGFVQCNRPLHQLLRAPERCRDLRSRWNATEAAWTTATTLGRRWASFALRCSIPSIFSDGLSYAPQPSAVAEYRDLCIAGSFTLVPIRNSRNS